MRELSWLQKKRYEKDSDTSLEKYVGGGGERQASKYLQGIRDDHLGRYELVLPYVSPQAKVLDMACGVGYGSYMIASETNCQSILAVDISKDAIAYGESYYSSEKIQYRCDNCFTTDIEAAIYDIAISFETIEHIKDDETLLKIFFDSLKPEGLLFLSTPNQLEMPYTKDYFPFHVKHYLPSDLKVLVESSGFKILEVFSQPNNTSREFIEGWNGKFNILVCLKM
ncbi:MAG: class I SAM-dependent methyltransferase [Phormidesmis sp.]